MIFGLFWMHGVFFRETYDTAVSFCASFPFPTKEKNFSPFFPVKRYMGKIQKAKTHAGVPLPPEEIFKFGGKLFGERQTRQLKRRQKRIFDRSGKFVWKEIRRKFNGASLRFPQKRNKTFFPPLLSFLPGCPAGSCWTPSGRWKWSGEREVADWTNMN